MRCLWLLPLALAAGYAQTDSAIQREGPYWVQTVSASVPILPIGRLQLETVGSVVVRGGSGSQVSYQLRKRVKADSEAEARVRLRLVTLKPRIISDLVRLTIDAPAQLQAVLELEMSVPRGLREVLLRTAWGGLQAYDLDGAVKAETGGGVLRADRIGKSLIALAGGGEVHIGTVNGPVHAISGSGPIEVQKAAGEMWIEASGGEILVRDAGGPLHVSTGGGNISVERAAATVFAQTAGGLIDVHNAGGIVTAQNAGGGIQVSSAQGVRCEAYSGTIRLRSASGALNASTAAGSIFAEFAGNRAADSILSTGGGDVTVFIPSNLAMTVRAKTETGNRTARIISDFPEIRVTPAALNVAVAEGLLHGGGPLLRISTSNGTIYLRRQK
jgi:hypothetical protein